MIRKSQEELVNKLSKHHYHFTQFALFNEGDYEIYDADWNYKDIPHLNILHKLVNGFPSFIDNSVITTIILQQVLGITIPMTVINYSSGLNRQTYLTSFLGFILIVETSWSSLGKIRTQVKTNYAIGSIFLLKFLHPIIKKLITKNYEVLMSEDIPMRTRRGLLRKWGYAFRTDGPSHSFEETLHVLDENMVYKADFTPPAPLLISANDLESIKVKDFLVGRSDHWGLRFHFENNLLQIFPRLCPHEGACLDTQNINNKTVSCPWHGRKLKPLAMISYPLEKELNTLELRYHSIKIDTHQLEIFFKDTPINPKVDPTEQIAEIDL